MRTSRRSRRAGKTNTRGMGRIEWKMSAMEHINYTSIDIEYDLPLPIINFRSKQS